VAPDGAAAREITLVVPSIGNLNGEGTVSPANQLDFRLRANVHTGGLLAVVDNTPIPITVQGTCADPIFRPDVKAVVAEKVKSLEGDAAKAAGGLIRGLLGGKK